MREGKAGTITVQGARCAEGSIVGSVSAVGRGDAEHEHTGEHEFEPAIEPGGKVFGWEVGRAPGNEGLVFREGEGERGSGGEDGDEAGE